MTPEERDQRMAALARANEIRTYRADLKRRLAAGEVKLGEVLRSGDWRLDSMRIREALVATPGIGPVKARRVSDQLRISLSLPLERITARRREEMLARLVTDHPRLKGRI